MGMAHPHSKLRQATRWRRQLQLHQPIITTTSTIQHEYYRASSRHETLMGRRAKFEF